MIEAHDLRKSFGAVRAVDGVTFEAHPGEVFGVLGPNGAGKTTTLRLLATTIKPDSGTALVQGHDVAREPVQARRACWRRNPRSWSIAGPTRRAR